MTTLTYTTNGLSTQDTTGAKGREEEKGCQDYLQQQAHPKATGSARKRDRIICVENASNVREPFILEEVGSVPELIEKLCEKFPTICINMIGMKISNSRAGTFGRKTYEGEIPFEDDTLYVTLYLKKHTPYYEGKIEPQGAPA